MTGLEVAFYIVGIVYMGVMLGVMIALLVVVLAIRAKVHALHARVDRTFHTATNIAAKVSPMLAFIGGLTQRPRK